MADPWAVPDIVDDFRVRLLLRMTLRYGHFNARVIGVLTCGGLAVACTTLSGSSQQPRLLDYALEAKACDRTNRVDEVVEKCGFL